MKLITKFLRQRKARQLFEKFNLGAVGMGLMLARVGGLNERGQFLQSRYNRNMERLGKLERGEAAW